MNLQALVDPLSAILVVVGTGLATLLRCGIGDVRATLHCLAQVMRPRFTAARARAELARQVEEIRQDGVFRARPHVSGDAEIADVTGALIRHRSIAALIEVHERHHASRQVLRSRALDLLGQAGELAPVFGLAGTLVALSQMPGTGLASDGLMVAVGTAVLTTLYGLLAAHLTIFPLASLIERHGEAEEAERQLLIDWLAAQCAQAVPPSSRAGGADPAEVAELAA